MCITEWKWKLTRSARGRYRSDPAFTMSLVSGPGRGGVAGKDAGDELVLFVNNHVKYIQSLDIVGHVVQQEF